MADPSKITFEDDVLSILKNIIRKTERVSDTVYRLFSTFNKVLEKNKNCFGDTLLSTLNYYMIYAKERFMND